jgi:hypothetical protein
MLTKKAMHKNGLIGSFTKYLLRSHMEWFQNLLHIVIIVWAIIMYYLKISMFADIMQGLL